jgi:hypothetical protein
MNEDERGTSIHLRCIQEIPMGSYGFLWVPMGSYGFLWVPMGSWSQKR